MNNMNNVKDIKEFIKTLKEQTDSSVDIFDGHLIVDDLASNRMVLSKMLKLLKITSEEAENGLEALQKISKKKYKLIWMDVKMPIMDGIESTKYMRDEFKYNGLIYAVTSYTDVTTQEKCIIAGMNKIISKPISVKLIKHLSDEININEKN